LGPTCNIVLTINVILNGFFIPAIIDTGAELNIVSDHLIRNKERSTRHSTLLLTAGGQKMPSLGETKTLLEIIGSYVGKWDIRATILKNPPQPLILGMEFLEARKATIDMEKKILTLEERLVIKFSRHQAKSTSQQNPRLHPQNKKS